MAQYKGNKSQASRVLGISRQGLLKKIERYGLTDLGDD
jgi:two-component system NtrC family response regulator